MTEFNSINFNNFNRANLNQAKAGLVNEVQNESQGQNQIIQNQLPQQNTSANQINQNLIYNMQMAKMDNEVLLKYLQNLLNLPNSIDKFVSQLNKNSIDSKVVKILLENLISTKALGEFLNQNSTEAISKLLQTMSNSLKSGINDISQLKEVLAILTSIQTSSINTNNNNLKELLLLYIPLNNQVFDIQGKFKEEDEYNKEIKNSTLSILLETINFSNVLCCLNEDNNKIFVEIFINKTFNKNEFNRIINAFCKETNINSFVEYKDKETSNNQKSVQNFKIISDSFIPTNILILSHLIIKTIFKLDSDFIETT